MRLWYKLYQNFNLTVKCFSIFNVFMWTVADIVFSHFVHGIDSINKTKDACPEQNVSKSGSLGHLSTIILISFTHTHNNRIGVSIVN